jgi:hypothetical protein
MATVYCSFGKVGKRGANGVIEVFNAAGGRSETITSSGTTAVGTFVATKDEMVQIACATSVAVVAGATPTATLATGIVAFAGVPQYVAVQVGDKIAVIDC